VIDWPPLVVMLPVAFGGGIIAFVALSFITRNQPQPSSDHRSSFAKAWMAGVLMVLIDVFFVVARVIGLTLTGAQPDVPVVFEGFYNWVGYSAGIAVAYWASEVAHGR
jgi:uncharacterized membrane protein YdcZ (DUF606 family)